MLFPLVILLAAFAFVVSAASRLEKAADVTAKRLKLPLPDQPDVVPITVA